MVVFFGWFFDDTGACSPPFSCVEEFAETVSEAAEMRRQFSRCLDGHPSPFVTQIVESGGEAELCGRDFGFRRDLGHFQPDEVMGEQYAPYLLIDRLGRKAAQGQLAAQHVVLDFAIARFDAPALLVLMNDLVGRPGSGIHQRCQQDARLAVAAGCLDGAAPGSGSRRSQTSERLAGISQ
jgi:hypothetical protein